MRAGFTGTRKGMSEGQRKYLESELVRVNAKELHHGDCTGADEEANTIARNLGLRIVIHPPIDSRLRAYCSGDEIRKPRSYIKRNHTIVDETRILFVAPRYNYEEQRSGTWATFRYADKINRKIIMIER